MSRAKRLCTYDHSAWTQALVDDDPLVLSKLELSPEWFRAACFRGCVRIVNAWPLTSETALRALLEFGFSPSLGDEVVSVLFQYTTPVWEAYSIVFGDKFPVWNETCRRRFYSYATSSSDVEELVNMTDLNPCKAVADLVSHNYWDAVEWLVAQKLVTKISFRWVRDNDKMNALFNKYPRIFSAKDVVWSCIQRDQLECDTYIRDVSRLTCMDIYNFVVNIRKSTRPLESLKLRQWLMHYNPLKDLVREGLLYSAFLNEHVSPCKFLVNWLIDFTQWVTPHTLRCIATLDNPALFVKAYKYLRPCTDRAWSLFVTNRLSRINNLRRKPTNASTDAWDNIELPDDFVDCRNLFNSCATTPMKWACLKHTNITPDAAQSILDSINDVSDKKRVYDIGGVIQQTLPEPIRWCLEHRANVRNTCSLPRCYRFVFGLVTDTKLKDHAQHVLDPPPVDGDEVGVPEPELDVVDVDAVVEDDGVVA